MDQNIHLQHLPRIIFTTIIEDLVVVIGIRKSVRLRSVSKLFNAAIMHALCVSQVVDISDPATPDLAARMPPPLRGKILLTKSRSPKTTEETYLAKCVAAIASVNEMLDRLTQPTVERRNEQHRFIAEAAARLHFPFRGPEEAGEVTTLDLLCGAVVLGNLPLVKSFRNSAEGLDIDSRSVYFGRPLLIAAAWGHTHIVRYLLDSGANPHALDYLNELHPHVYRSSVGSALSAAMLGGHEEIVHLLQEPRLSADEYSRAILAGVRGGHIHLCQLLAPSGFHGLKEAMLSEAVLHNQQAIVQVLLDSGADVNKGCWPSPLYIAATRGSAPMVRFLLERGADDTVDPRGWSTLSCTSPVFLAANYGHQEVVEIFLERGARSASVFEAAVDGGQAHLVEWLLAKYPDLPRQRRQLFEERKLGLHSLWKAILRRNPRLISILVNAGVPLNDTNYKLWEKPIITAKTLTTVRAILGLGTTETDVVTAEMLAEDWIVKYLFSLGAEDEDADQKFYTTTYAKYSDEGIRLRPERQLKMTRRTWEWAGKY